MKRIPLAFKKGFHVAIDAERAQAAEMTIAPGGKEGGPGNRHRGADQWLFIVAGRGEACVKGRRVPLEPGDLLLIERGEEHEIRNTGDGPLETLNLYVPPAFKPNGDPLPAGEP